MPSNLHSKDLRTQGIVLHRTNYGETDRILNILTPEGKLSVMAKAVRRPGSKLAGGVEMFCLSDIVVHQGKSELGILTSAKMLTNYHNILSDLKRLEFASQALKSINKVTNDVADPEHFQLLKQVLAGLNDGMPIDVVKLWFDINFRKLSGEEYNFYTDIHGDKLKPDVNYRWNVAENAFEPYPDGLVGTNQIKLLRLMSTGSLAMVSRVKNIEKLIKNLVPPAGIEPALYP
ncbi:DNA repair protein RecO [Candidatus Saccharibacteria bacterium]|nr:DNA repair protein RecO [Candidatus Saccharibacteria bacterium]